MAPPSPPVFISYSFKDSDWKSRILGVLKSRGVDVWEDSRLETGDNFDEVIHRAIDSARVAVLLITPNYLSSPTIQKEQVPYLLARQSRLRLYPILVEACEWQSFDWLNRLLLFPSDLEPLARTEEGRLAPRLALAALEISSFAGTPTVPQMVAAKVQGPDGKFEGTATLLRSDVAISTPAGDISDQRPRTLNFALAPSPAEVSVEYRDPALNICLLRPQESLLLPVPPFTATAPRPGRFGSASRIPRQAPRASSAPAR